MEADSLCMVLRFNVQEQSVFFIFDILLGSLKSSVVILGLMGSKYAAVVIIPHE
jgi:hypothetical protein